MLIQVEHIGLDPSIQLIFYRTIFDHFLKKLARHNFTVPDKGAAFSRTNASLSQEKHSCLLQWLGHDLKSMISH